VRDAAASDGPPPPAGGRGLPVLAGAVLWGTTGTAQALAPATASPLAVGSTRLVVGGALLVAWAVAAQRRPGTAAPPPARRTPAGGVACASSPGTSGSARACVDRRAGHGGRRAVVVAAAAGALGVAAYQLAFFAAVDAAGVALGTAVAIGSSPVWTGVLEGLLGRGLPGRRWAASTAAAAVGVALLAGPSRLDPLGVALALGAGLAYAAYAVASKALLDAGLPGPGAMAVVFGVGGLLLLPVAAAADLRWLGEPRGAAVLAWLGGVTVLLAYLLFAAGLRQVPASTAATLSLAEPLTAAVLGVLVLGERPTATAVAGAALVLGGLLLAAPRRAGTAPATAGAPVAPPPG
jgi:drug/metabolite transporter, DME family